MVIAFYVGGGLGTLGLFFWLAKRAARRSVAEMARDYKKYFPGKCLICGYTYWGWTMGHASSPDPGPHACIEGNAHGRSP